MMPKILMSENGTVLFFEENKPISQMVKGVIITCKKCRKKELVVKGSFCDALQLCIVHTQEELKKRRII
jgi:hypothetical protein